MHRLGITTGITALLLLVGLALYAVTTAHPVLPELIVAVLVDVVLWLAADRLTRPARPLTREADPAGGWLELDTETADAARRIHRRLATEQR